MYQDFSYRKKIDDFNKVKVFLVKLVQFYLLYTFLYIPQILYAYITEGKSIAFNVMRFIRNFFLTGSYTQLWYFVGLIVAALLLYLLVKILKISDKNITIIVLVLYFIGTIMNAYMYPLKDSLKHMSISEIIKHNKQYFLLWSYFKVFSTTRNGIFFGLPYLFFGYLISKNRNQIFRKNYFLLSAISFAAMTIEAFVVLKVFGSHEQDMLFMLLPTSIFLFLFILFLDCKNNIINVQTAKHYKILSMLYFGLHLFINFYAGEILNRVFGIKLYSLNRFIIIVIVNYIVAESIIRISNIPSFTWMKKLY